MYEKFIKIEKVFEKITTAICYISFIGLFAIMFLNVADVLMSKLFSPIMGSYEITSRLLLCTVFASFAYAQTKKLHINMTFVIVRFPQALRFSIFTLLSVVSIIFSALLTYAAFYQGGVSYAENTTTEVLLIPLYPFFYVQSFAMATFTVTLIFDTIVSFFAIFKKDFADHVMASWE